METRIQINPNTPDVKSKNETHMLTLWISGNYDSYFDTDGGFFVLDFWAKILADLTRGIVLSNYDNIDNEEVDNEQLLVHMIESLAKHLFDPKFKAVVENELIDHPDPCQMFH